MLEALWSQQCKESGSASPGLRHWTRVADGVQQRFEHGLRGGDGFAELVPGEGVAAHQLEATDVPSDAVDGGPSRLPAAPPARSSAVAEE